ncbi:hypothetical protein F7734_05660 [Scytonema sp. UIC 10036]|uniref:hypothetical protein n=1 Tax=Scytonema sp. UIC 10036 TaxID=2304196 RepID=UPI0012DA42E0|nr:hypothetical protein [Scytonema sp. UIC 10036]MUG91971.1 hypothetical protein [Scytonema sp. UIC 10036]
MTDDYELISREEALAGLPAKRANTLLFLIESQTAHLVTRSRVEFSLTESAANERALAFLEAFALGQAPPLHPTIQHLEQYAPQWSPLVPENPKVKAAVIHAMSQKYNFTYQTIPHIRLALSMDEDRVQQTYYRQYRKQLDTVFAPRLSLTEQIRWSANLVTQRVESLPPFWIASLVTVALGLPQAFLALPIACATVGPLITLIFLIVLGAINILTMVCMAEAISRSGDFRYNNAFIKQLAANYLGSAGSFILSLAVGIRVFLIALACYIGLSTAMANFTPISAQIWAIILFLIGLYFISRKSVSFTVTVMVLLAAINVSLLLLLSLLAFRHLELSNLLYINLPFFNGNSFKPQILHQVFGVMLMLYFGHIYVGECAKLVLPRDKSAASLIWGSVAGTAFLTVLFCVWVLAINGAIAPQVLASQSGTVLEPLAQQVGPIVKIIGAVLVTFLLGMAWIRSSSLLVNIVKEWLPSKPQPILMLPCQRGRLILQPRNHSNKIPHIGLTYLGLAENHPKFRLDIQLNGNIRHIEIIVYKRWEIKEILSQLKGLERNDVNLIVEVQSANSEVVCLKITSSMILTYEGILQGTNTAEQQKDRQLWLSLLVKQRLLLSISPLILVFLLTEWLFFADTQSFANVLGFAGVLGNSLVGGIFPVLILASSRRKGEMVPSVVFQLLNHPLLLTAIYSFFLIVLIIHGLFIWEHPIARTSAIGIAIMAIVTTFIMKYTGAFTQRTVVEMREEHGEKTIFSITAGGQPKIAKVCLGYAEGEQKILAATVEIPSPSSLSYATFQLPTKRTEELRVWAHKDKPNGDFESLPAYLEVCRGNKKMQFDLKLSGGKVLLPAIGNECYLTITWTGV